MGQQWELLKDSWFRKAPFERNCRGTETEDNWYLLTPSDFELSTAAEDMVITTEDDDTTVTTPATPIQAPDTIPITAVDVEEDAIGTLACNNAHLGSVLYVYLFL